MEPPELQESESSTEPNDRTTVVYLAVLFEGGLLALAWILGWAFGHLPLATCHWSLTDALLGIGFTLPMVGLFMAMMRWPVGPVGKMKDLTESFIRPLMAPCTVLDLFGISILAGLGEEMLFRGVFQSALTVWLASPLLGLVGASVIFGLGHSLTWFYALFATIMGLYLGWIWMTWNNLLIVIVAHALYDFIALVLLLRVMAPEKNDAGDDPS